MKLGRVIRGEFALVLQTIAQLLDTLGSKLKSRRQRVLSMATKVLWAMIAVQLLAIINQILRMSPVNWDDAGHIRRVILMSLLTLLVSLLG